MGPGDDEPRPADAVEVGRIGEAWGIQGWFRVHPHAGDPQALFSSKRWFLAAPEAGGPRRPAGTGPARPLPARLAIAQAREHGGGVVAKARDIDDRDGAEALRGARIFISRASFPTADDGEYYWVDLIGLAVVNREERLLGEVIGLLDTGPHAVLRIAPPGRPAGTGLDPADELLIPFVGAYVDDVSLPERRIRVDWGADF
ncbi:ribosome maturation factor RimM [Piscinibacter sakaiensis]|uniref:Ribosome maturation factor RimM n=1 Tax=Piscinibacter sakaiensis TaxID=1547922 RepID=A0A0K8NV51_PISS1|nr:ribosome maturation factor RimM [Piscinibacter sakaiensis]GAP33825.1 16S rRNA processing protein RimM [Piscinibacter sakaiensis]